MGLKYIYYIFVCSFHDPMALLYILPHFLNMCRVSLKRLSKLLHWRRVETHCFCSVSLETPPCFYNLLKTKSDSQFLRTIIEDFFLQIQKKY